MALDHLRAPVDRFEAPAINLEVVTKCRRLALAEPVYVDDGNQIVQLINTRRGRCFPDASLGAFAVAKQHVGAKVQIVQPRTQCHANAEAQTLSKRTCRHIHERKSWRGMAF